MSFNFGVNKKVEPTKKASSFGFGVKKAVTPVVSTKAKTTSPQQYTKETLPRDLGGGSYYIQRGEPNKLIKPETEKTYGSLIPKAGQQRDHFIAQSLGGASDDYNLNYVPSEVNQAWGHIETKNLNAFNRGELSLPQARLNALKEKQEWLLKQKGISQSVKDNLVQIAKDPINPVNMVKGVLKKISSPISLLKEFIKAAAPEETVKAEAEIKAKTAPKLDQSMRFQVGAGLSNVEKVLPGPRVSTLEAMKQGAKVEPVKQGEAPKMAETRQADAALQKNRETEKRYTEIKAPVFNFGVTIPKKEGGLRSVVPEIAKAIVETPERSVKSFANLGKTVEQLNKEDQKVYYSVPTYQQSVDEMIKSGMNPIAAVVLTGSEAILDVAGTGTILTKLANNVLKNASEVVVTKQMTKNLKWNDLKKVSEGKIIESDKMAALKKAADEGTDWQSLVLNKTKDKELGDILLETETKVKKTLPKAKIKPQEAQGEVLPTKTTKVSSKVKSGVKSSIIEAPVKNVDDIKKSLTESASVPKGMYSTTEKPALYEKYVKPQIDKLGKIKDDEVVVFYNGKGGKGQFVNTDPKEIWHYPVNDSLMVSKVKKSELLTTGNKSKDDIGYRLLKGEVSKPINITGLKKSLPKKQPIKYLPIEEAPRATGKIKYQETIGQSKLAKGVETKAIEKKLTEGFADLPEYEKINIKDQASKAKQLIDTDYSKAERIALGKELPPEGVLPESVFIAVEQKAIKNGDVDTLRKLATESGLSNEATLMGQRIRILAERAEDAPTTAMKKVLDQRKAYYDLKHKTPLNKAIAREVDTMKKVITKAAPKKDEWFSFVSELTCK